MARRKRLNVTSECRRSIAPDAPDVRKMPKHEVIRQTIETWQPYYARHLSPEDAREILENTIGFFRILREWQAAERRISKQ